MRYYIRALWCHWTHGHKYGRMTFGMGPNGYYIGYRVCVRCEWIKTKEY